MGFTPVPLVFFPIISFFLFFLLSEGTLSGLASPSLSLSRSSSSSPRFEFLPRLVGDDFMLIELQGNNLTSKFFFPLFFGQNSLCLLLVRLFEWI